MQSRLSALTIRHTLRLRAPHDIGVHQLAIGLDATLSALKRPIGLLQRIREAEALDQCALASTLSEAIAALNETASALRRRASLKMIREPTGKLVRPERNSRSAHLPT